MITTRQLDAFKRAETLLDAVCKFIATNPVRDYQIFYDDAYCDASCLSDDCDILLEEIQQILLKEYASR